MALNGIVSAVLASAAAAACDGKANDTSSVVEPNNDDAGKGPDAAPDDSTLACDSPLADYTSNLHPAVAIDHVELRTRARTSYIESDAGDAGTAASTLETEQGTACATASDAAACQTALDEARLGTRTGWTAKWTDGWGAVPPLRFLVFTRGDEVGVIDTTEALASFLAPIDTLEEARLLLSTKANALECKTEPFKTGWKRSDDDGWEITTDASDCGNVVRLRTTISSDGVVTIVKREDLVSGSVCGRRPDGLVATQAGGAEQSLAAWLAEAAHLEAASVVAFRQLERELRQLDAPQDLLVRARRSRADEIRHAREMTKLARRFGSEPACVAVQSPTTRTPFAIALENAVEGCVRETYGALVANYQARRATDPAIRSVLERIAKDEARHAALAHDVAAWLEPLLDTSERAEIAMARDAAIDELREALRQAPAADVVRLAGMPSSRDALALLDLLEVQVLRDAA